MGSKNNPGKFDCYADADPDEPLFVLAGRDPAAALVVKLWVALRREMGLKADKEAEAVACAAAMKKWAVAIGKGSQVVEAAYALDRVVGKALRDAFGGDDFDRVT
jgi:hypothetical protein